MFFEPQAHNVIEPSSERGKELGFTSDLYDGYLWEESPDSIIVSLIVSKKPHQGNVRRLLDTLESIYPKVRVPTPSARMRHILERRGYTQGSEETPMGACEYWYRP